MEKGTKIQSPETLGELQDKLRASVGSETVLRVIDPLARERERALLRQLASAPADLAILLDLRGRIAENLRIQDALRDMVHKGEEAKDTLVKIFGDAA